MDRDLRAAAVAVEAAAGEKGWNTKDLAGAADVDPATVADFLRASRWPRNVTRAAIEKALGWPVGSIAQIAQGGAAPVASSSAHDAPAVDDLVAEVSQLTPRQQDAVLAVVRAMREPGEKGFVQLATGSGKSGTVAHLADLARQEPDLSRVAARRGESEGRRRREEQDDDAGS